MRGSGHRYIPWLGPQKTYVKPESHCLVEPVGLWGMDRKIRHARELVLSPQDLLVHFMLLWKTKPLTKSNLWEERIYSAHRSRLIPEGSQGRNSSRNLKTGLFTTLCSITSREHLLTAKEIQQEQWRRMLASSLMQVRSIYPPTKGWAFLLQLIRHSPVHQPIISGQSLN